MKKLITLISTEGKPPEQIKREVHAAYNKYKQAEAKQESEDSQAATAPSQLLRKSRITDITPPEDKPIAFQIIGARLPKPKKILNLLGLKKKTMADNAALPCSHGLVLTIFYGSSKLRKLHHINTFLRGLMQIFEMPEYKDMFADKPEMAEALATEVLKYLSGQDPKEGEEMTYKSENEKATLEMARRHVHKWADDAMEKDSEFAKLRLMSLRLDMSYSQYVNGDEYIHTARGKRIMDLLNKYGHLSAEEATPEKYSKLIKQWMKWSEHVIDK